MSSWASIAICAKNSKKSGLIQRREKKARKKLATVKNLRAQMLAFAESKGVSFAVEPTSAFLVKFCGDQMGTFFNPENIADLSALSNALPLTEKRKVRRRPKPKPATDFYMSRAWRALRFEVLKESDGKCQLCGASKRTGAVMHVDHIKPRSKYPRLQLEKKNLQVLCEACNMGKSNRDETDWREDAA